MTYFAEAQRESHIARYAALKRSTARQVAEIEEKARRFLVRIEAILA